MSVKRQIEELREAMSAPDLSTEIHDLSLMLTHPDELRGWLDANLREWVEESLEEGRLEVEHEGIPEGEEWYVKLMLYLEGETSVIRIPTEVPLNEDGPLLSVDESLDLIRDNIVERLTAIGIRAV